MASVQTKYFTEWAEPMQAAVAKVIKEEMERRTRIPTKPVGEWVRVMVMANTVLLIGGTPPKMNIEPDSKTVLELLVRQYLLVGIKPVGFDEQ